MGRVWTIVGLLAASAAGALIVFSLVDDPAPPANRSSPSTEVVTTSAAAIATTTEVSTTSSTVASTAAPTPTAAPTSASTTAAVSSSAPSTTAPLGDLAVYRVRVVNGGAPGGTAGLMSAVLRNAGFSPQPQGDAEGDSLDTVVLVGQGKEAAGQAVAAALLLPVESVRTGANDGRWAANGGDQLDVLVVAGENLQPPG